MKIGRLAKALNNNTPYAAFLPKMQPLLKFYFYYYMKYFLLPDVWFWILSNVYCSEDLLNTKNI